MTLRHDDAQIEAFDPIVGDILRRKSFAERLAMIGDANHTMRSLIGAHVRACHPQWDGNAVAAEVARRMAGGAA